MKKTLAVVVIVFMFSVSAWAHGVEKQGVYFVTPQDASMHQKEVHLVMGIKGMTVKKAGELQVGTGHFHIIIDGDFVPKGTAVGKNATHIHFGKGQVETVLKLPKGEHTLTLQFADGHHISYGQAWSQSIRVKMK